MSNLRLNDWLKSFFILCSMGWVSLASADTDADLPFNSTMNLLKNAITGPFLMSVSIIMIVVTCLMLAFGEWGDGFKKLINIVLWLSIAFSATSFVTTLFSA
ncbi:MAG: TrbC/VirB2 family protein [Candidatus Aquirickettsiella sp.]